MKRWVRSRQTLEITRFQVGEDATKPVNLIVSTLAEAEFLLPMLKEYQKQGRKVNVGDGNALGPSPLD